MKSFGFLLLVAAFSSFAESSEKIERFAAPPFPVHRINSTAASKKNSRNTHEQQTSASELSPNSLAHQIHAQRVAAEQQARLSKLAFGSHPPSTTLVATSLHQASPGNGGLETSPIAYSIIRQRSAGPGPEASQRFAVAQPQPAVHYHPVMRYMTFIQHPGAQLQIPIQTHSVIAPQPQPLVSPSPSAQQAYFPSAPPRSPYSSSPYSGDKVSSKYSSGSSKAPSPSPSSSPYRLVSSTKSIYPLKSPYSSSSSSGAANALSHSEQPISRPLYSPAAVPLPSKYASQSGPPPSSLRDPEPDPESYPALPEQYSSVNDPNSGPGGPASYIAEYHAAPPMQEYHYTVPSSAASGQYEPQGEIQQLVPISISPETMREIYGEASKTYASKSPLGSSIYAASVSALPPQSQSSDPNGGEAPPPPSPYSQVYNPYTSPAYMPYLQGQRSVVRVAAAPPASESGPSSPPAPAPGQFVRYSSSTLALSPVSRPPSSAYPVSSYSSSPGPKSRYEGSSIGSSNPQLASYFSQSAGVERIPQSQYQKLLAQSGISEDGIGNAITELIPEISSIYGSPYKR